MLDPVLYWLLLLPATIPVFLLASYSAWLGWQLFINN